MSGAPHILPFRVYYEDTDAGGVVYHANYLRFAERARTEMLRHKGIPVADLWKDHGVAFLVRQCTIDFRAPAVLDDSLWVKTEVVEMSTSAITFSQHIGRSEDTILAHITIVLVAVNASKRSTRIPDHVRQVLAQTDQGKN